MRINSLALVVLGSTAVLFAGCGHKEPPIIGTWTGSDLLITVNEDKTFTGGLSTSDKMLWFEGGWKANGDDFVLTMRTMMNLPIDKAKLKLESIAPSNLKLKAFAEKLDTPMVFNVAEDGRSIVTTPARSAGGAPALKLESRATGG